MTQTIIESRWSSIIESLLYTRFIKPLMQQWRLSTMLETFCVSYSMNYFDCHQDRDHFGTDIGYGASGHAAMMLLNVMGSSAISLHGLYPADYPHAALGFNDVNLAASDNQYLQLTDNQTWSWDNIVPHDSTTEIGVPSDWTNAYTFNTSHPGGTHSVCSASMEWSDTTIDPLYASQHQAITDLGPLTQWDTQYPDSSQFPTSFSPMDNSVSPAQTTPSQEDLGSNYPPSYAEQYLLDIEQREGDSLSIHLRIPPSIPGALYFDNYLMTEFSQEADGTLNVHVYLPPGYANINSTFVHA